MKFITGIRMRDDGWITHVRWQTAESVVNPRWIGQPQIEQVEEVVAALLNGDRVGAVFGLLGFEAVHERVMPAVRTIRDGLGNESIEDLPGCRNGRRLRDLPRI